MNQEMEEQDRFKGKRTGQGGGNQRELKELGMRGKREHNKVKDNTN